MPAPLIDIDGLLVREMGMPISQIFGMVGEARFREMERDAVNAAQGGNPGVIVPGGGWAAQPGQLEAALASSLVVYLKCLPGTAAQPEPARGSPAAARRGGSGPADAGAPGGTGAVLSPGDHTRWTPSADRRRRLPPRFWSWPGSTADGSTGLWVAKETRGVVSCYLSILTIG